MKHRVLSMLLALVMVVSLLPAAAEANEAEKNTGAEIQKGSLEMRYDGSYGNGKEIPVGERKVCPLLRNTQPRKSSFPAFGCASMRTPVPLFS